MWFKPFPRVSRNPFFPGKSQKAAHLHPKQRQQRNPHWKLAVLSWNAAFHAHDVMNLQGSPLTKNILFLFHLRYTFGDVPVPFDSRKKVFFFLLLCILQRVFLVLSQCKLRDGACSCRLGSRTHTPAMSTIPMVRSFQVIALFFFFFSPNALETRRHTDAVL